MPGPASPVGFDETQHPRGQPDNAGQFRRKQVPQPPPARRRGSRLGTPAAAGKEWHPPGYTPGFTDYYKDMVPGNATAEQLDAWAESHDHLLLAAVACHPNTDESTLTYLACQGPLSGVTAALLANPKLPADALAEIHASSGDMPRDEQTRTICEAHPNWAGVNV